MPTPETYLSFGTIVSAIGISLICFHVRAHRRQRFDEQLSDVDRRFFERQYGRRMQTSALAVTLGSLIGLCGYIKAMEDSPIFATVYVMILLVLALWLVLLALSDMLASRVYASKLHRRNHKMLKPLEETLAEVRRAHGLDARN